MAPVLTHRPAIDPAGPIVTLPPAIPAAARAADPVTGTAHAALDRLAAGLPRLGIAVSGGGDSMALLHLVQGWAAGRGVALAAVSLDHGLRGAQSAAEVDLAAAAAHALGIPHSRLFWHDRPQGGNLLAAARHARSRLFAHWAAGHGISAIALGHTRDDLAETLLMQLGRGAGLDGLAAMAEARTDHGIDWLRPLLDCGRDALRDWLRARAIAWADDPSNNDPAYDRARLRAAMAGLGLDPAMLARSARNLAMARDALIPAALALVADARAADGALALPLAPLLGAPAELRRRVLVAALGWVSDAGHPPRQAGLDRLLAAMATGRRMALGGVLVTPGPLWLHLAREPAAAARAGPLHGAGIWDRRFAVAAPPPGCHVAALPGRAEPGLWRGGTCLGPARATPLRDLAALRRLISAPRRADSGPLCGKTPPIRTKPH